MVLSPVLPFLPIRLKGVPSLFGYSPYVNTTAMLPAPSLPLVYLPTKALTVNQAARHAQLAIVPDVHCTTLSCSLQSGIREDTTAPGSETLTWLP